MDITINLSVPPILIEGLQAVAVRHGHSLQYELEEALVFYLDVIDTMDADGVPVESERSFGAAMLGQLGGKKGGRARAEKLTPERRKEIAKKAAEARWGRKGDDSGQKPAPNDEKRKYQHDLS